MPQSPSSAATEPEFVNDSQPIEIEDDEPEGEDIDVGSKMKLTSAVWKEFKRVKMLDEERPNACTVARRSCHQKQRVELSTFMIT